MKHSTKTALKWKVRTILEDEEFVKFEYYLENNLWTSLRMFMSDTLEDYDLRVMLEENTLEEYLVLEEVENVIMDTAIGIYDEMNEEEEIHEGRECVKTRDS